MKLLCVRCDVFVDELDRVSCYFNIIYFVNNNNRKLSIKHESKAFMHKDVYVLYFPFLSSPNSFLYGLDNELYVVYFRNSC